MYVCIVCICIYVSMCIYVYIYVYMYVCVYICMYVCVYVYIYILATQGGMWDPSSPTRDQTHTPCTGSLES